MFIKVHDVGNNILQVNVSNIIFIRQGAEYTTVEFLGDTPSLPIMESTETCLRLIQENITGKPRKPEGDKK